MYLTDNPKVVPFRLTLGTEQYKKFLEKDFRIVLQPNMEIFRNFITTHNGFKIGDNDFTIDNENNLFYVNSKYIVPIPKTIWEFVDYCYCLSLDIYWTESVVDNFEPKDFLEQNKIRIYFEELLTIMDKSDELL